MPDASGTNPLHRALLATAEECCDAVYFRFGERAYSFAETAEQSAALASALAGRGIAAGDEIAVDLPNSDGFVLLIFAAARLGVSLLLLNHRLTAAKKAELLEDSAVRLVVTPTELAALRAEMGLAAGTSAHSTPRTSAHSTGGTEAPTASRAERPSVVGQPFVTLFTSGTTGRAKAAGLTADNLLAAAGASNARLNRPGTGVWQLALPMFHIGGLQVVLRSLLNRSTFVLYDRFDAGRVLADQARWNATHLSVVDRMLQDLLAEKPSAVARYEVILLGGGAPNESTLASAHAAGARVYLSYGMTEACSQIATSLAAEARERGLEPLDGYALRILAPDAEGYGEIAVAGPAVFSGYRTQAGETRARDFVDGYFRTGDRGRLIGNRLEVAERVGDLFVSGGENVYPAEIERELRDIPGVSDAVVIGVEDAKWGRRPVAFVVGDVARGAIDAHLVDRLSGFQRPDRVYLLAKLPRTAIGKVDRQRLIEIDRARIEIAHVRLYRITQPLATPFSNSRETITQRESVIVEVIDHAGRSGFGEGVAFSTPWYTAETVDSTWSALTEHLVPTVLGRVYAHPSEVAASLAPLPGNLMAKGAIEPACWDLFARVAGKPLALVLAEAAGIEDPDASLQAPAAGVSLGLMPLPELLGEVERYVGAGYGRVKLKIAPGDDIARIASVRAHYPHLMLAADANRAYTAGAPETEAALHALDAFDLALIEEPIDGTIEEVAELQMRLDTTLSLDESIDSQADLARALAQPGIRNINLKIGKFGGVEPSLALYRHARERGLELWLGGMYETGVSKYLHAAFEQLPGFNIPGDISESRRYFERDIVIPEVRVEDGVIVVPSGAGLAFELDRERVAALAVDIWESA